MEAPAVTRTAAEHTAQSRLPELFELRPLSRIRSKQGLPTNDSRALRFKERAQFWCEK
jgi:hypothetical protein